MAQEPKGSFQSGFTFPSETMESTENLSSQQQQGLVYFTSQACHYKRPRTHAANFAPVASFAQCPNSQPLAPIPFDRVNPPTLNPGIADCSWVGYMEPNWDMETNNLGFYPSGGGSLASTASLLETTQRSKFPPFEQQNAHYLSPKIEIPR